MLEELGVARNEGELGGEVMVKSRADERSAAGTAAVKESAVMSQAWRGKFKYKQA